MTPHERTEALAHLSSFMALALDADRIGSGWALLSWLERLSSDAAELADDLLDELRQELERERRAAWELGQLD